MHASHACHVRRLTHVTPTARHGTRDASDDFKRALDVDDEVCAALVSPVVWVGLRRLGRRSDAVLRGRCPPQVSGALVAAARTPTSEAAAAKVPKPKAAPLKRPPSPAQPSSARPARGRLASGNSGAPASRESHAQRGQRARERAATRIQRLVRGRRARRAFAEMLGYVRMMAEIKVSDD